MTPGVGTGLSSAQARKWPPAAPGLVSVCRILAAIALAASAYAGARPILLFWIILGAALSDYFDGWLARRLHKSSFEGKVLDFSADKIFLTVSFLVLARAGMLEPVIAACLVSYHLLVLAATTVVSWGVGKPLVAIPTGEKLVVILSFVLAASKAGAAALPGKGVYTAVAHTAEFLALASIIFGIVGYLRLIRRLLARYAR